MNIRIEKDDARRFSYTDRINGYLELNSSTAAAEQGGYFRGEKKLLSDFFVSMDCLSLNSGASDLWRTNALYTDVRPEGFDTVFNRGPLKIIFTVSLLLDEQAFCLSLTESAENTLVLYPGTAPSSVGLASARGAGILLPGTSRSTSWHKSVEDGITIYRNGTGCAVASSSSFQLETSSERIILFSGDMRAVWYLVFEEDGEKAIRKAKRLALEKGIDAHRKKIADFFAQSQSSSGDARFDEAVRWAQFSGWLLVTENARSSDEGEKSTGIWAGLPWFRDNWGRDTFIALTGILLVSGRFAEARAVLSSFSCHQNTNPESPDYGRIPNRYRGKDDIIFNTADGTLWFIRALWEYVQYSGDTAILRELEPTIDLALEADITRRTDAHGFLLHGDADTWMDARVRGDKPWSPRGDRACDIQALWYTALCIGERVARFLGNGEKEAARESLAKKLKKSFRKFFWCDDRNALADRLPPGPHGEWLRDFRVRPNQLFALTVPSILDGHGEGCEDALVDPSMRSLILENVARELVSPFGLFSLCPDDPLFHAHHEKPERHHKDAAYHNGTIWVWNTGPYVSAVSDTRTGDLPSVSAALLKNEASLILEQGCAGTLSENIHAERAPGGKPILSGTWSQAWSVSEFARNVFQDIVGFNPRLAEGRIEMHPHLPEDTVSWSARCAFGPSWHMSVVLERNESSLRCTLLWTDSGALIPADLPALTVNGTAIECGKPLELFFPFAKKINGRISPFAFPRHDFAPDWCGSVHQRDYLERLVQSDRVNGRGGSDVNAASLEWFFDSDFFRKKYQTGLPLGALWSPDETVFRLWAPTARSVRLVLYPDGTDSSAVLVMAMKAGSLERENAGVWELPVAGDQSGMYYRFRVQTHGIIRESADPYARACGVNGSRSMVVDFDSSNANGCNPAGWDSVQAPSLSSPNDAVVYEVHVADITSSPHWNGEESLKRTYLGAAFSGTSHEGVPTGFDHIRSLGVTHVQLLPVFDFGSVDERLSTDDSYGEQLKNGKFNWGYDPENYTCPEGSYSTDPFNGEVRIRELKTLIQTFLGAGIGVIMDVVYNHVPAAQNQSLGICLPGYYFRVDSFSGAGDDTASEREMFRSYMIKSLSWWLTEYKLSGFRFDLMGLHDVETMNAIVTELQNIKSDVLIYGEGWDMYRGGKMVSASMLQAKKMKDIGFFNDALRCAIKGSVFKAHEGGFIHDGSHLESVKFGLVGAVYHGQVHNRWVDGTANRNPWTGTTRTSVNYTEIHDNATLYDKLVLVENNESEEYYERMQKMAIGLVLLAQGQSVLHAGMEFMRTKEIPSDIIASHPGMYDLYHIHGRAFSHNSYNLCDRINALDWARCADKKHVVEYVRRLIALRLAHPLFRLRTAAEVASCLTFLDPPPPDSPGLPHSGHPGSAGHAGHTGPPLLAWKIDGAPSGDSWAGVCVIVNPSRAALPFILPPEGSGASWHLVTDGAFFTDEKSEAKITDRTVSIAGKALYLYAEF